MTKKILAAILSTITINAMAQKTYLLPSGTESNADTYKHIIQNGNKTITDVAIPSIDVYLPDPAKSNGCAVILCPGGALRVLSWTSDVEEMAKLLNENGIAAIGLKYHLNTEPFPKGLKMPPTVDVTGFGTFKDADANPLHYAHGDSILELATRDALDAMRLVREHLKDWNIDKVGYVGFSAGGGVAISAAMASSDSLERPDFLCTNFGPSLKSVKVPEQAPPLLILSRVDHPNVAAGLVSLFMEWKKAGANAEMHLYGDGKGPYQLMKQEDKTTTEAWSSQLLLWLRAQGFCK